MTRLNETHDPALRSWLESANRLDADFPIQNLPFGIFARPGEEARVGVAIGDSIVDVAALADQFRGPAAAAARLCGLPFLNGLMAAAADEVSQLRAQLSSHLRAGSVTQDAVTKALVPMSDVQMRMPFKVAGYTDFFASIHHATNAGALFRPNQPLLPNYKYVPIAYNGRANSLRLSGAPVLRPWGQLKLQPEAPPSFLPSERLDYEVELGLVVGRGSSAARPISVDNAWDHVFGFVLLNDWSARDIQSWEYQPLGPFLAKSFATTISPWVVTAEALAPYRVPAPQREPNDPAILPHLWSEQDQKTGALDVVIEARLTSQTMRSQGHAPYLLSTSNASTLYWTFAQMLAHHTSNASAVDCGDVLGSGTISGPDAAALGSLLEITAGGQRPLELPTGEQRRFLADGDEVAFSGYCKAVGRIRIGFGDCRAIVASNTRVDS